MTTEINQQIREIQQRLAEKKITCPEDPHRAVLHHWTKCLGGCKGTRKVPLLPGLRVVCPCLEDVSTECDRCHAKQGHRVACLECKGTGWVLSDSSTDTLYDALEGQYGKLVISVCWMVGSGIHRAIIGTVTPRNAGYGENQDRRLAQWLAAEALVKEMEKT